MELIEVLKKNKKLRKITLSHNGINIRFIDEVNSYLNRNEFIAIERVMPDFQREIHSMRNDKKEYDKTCKDLVNACINKASVVNRVKV